MNKKPLTDVDVKQWNDEFIARLNNATEEQIKALAAPLTRYIRAKVRQIQPDEKNNTRRSD